MKKKIVSTVFYTLMISMFFIPWITIGDKTYNVFTFTFQKTMKGLEPFLADAGISADKLNFMNSAVSVETMLLYLVLVFSGIYLATRWVSKKRYPFNMVVLWLGVGVAFYHHRFTGTLNDLCGGSPISTVCTLMFILIPAAEFFTIMVMERWRETVDESRAYAEEEKAWKKEVKERLAFAGKYNKSFYRIVWKNFKSNWKDYVLLLFCCSLIFAFVVVGFGIKKIMSLEYNLEEIQIFNSLNSILINAIVPLAIVSVFIIIMLIFYYLKCRAKNYGVFLTLGMRRKALYYFSGLEFFSVFVIAIITGGMLGSAILYLFTLYSEVLLGVSVEFSSIGGKTYLYAIGTVILVFIASAMAARDIFVDFNVGKSTDLRAIGEPLPMKFRKGILSAGVIVCLFCLWQYSFISNYEKIYFLLGFAAGLFVVIRYGIAEYLIRSRRNKKYLKRTVTESQLFHKSKSHSGYIFALALMQICVLFYFSFQVVSSAIVEDNDTLFPYDFVCIAEDSDEEFFAELQEKYELELSTYPMVRVSNYDSTEKWEGKEEGDPIQGQQIGISESTYHELKKQLDPDYEAKDLGLKEDGSNVYVVHQQDKSTKAQPVDFYGMAIRPILMVGQPTFGSVDLGRISRWSEDTAFHYHDVVGEEIGSVTGAFRQGLRENLIVFSDEYFAKAQGLWEITDRNSGLLTHGDYYEMYYAENAVNDQGPTMLVLINADEGNTDAVYGELQDFREKYIEDEAYDASVSSVYARKDAEQNLQSERYMKMVMNTLVIAVFFVMNIVLVAIMMLSELDANRRRADFLTCMGMYTKDRNRLIKKEILFDHHVLPLAFAIISSLAFTFIVFDARMYTVVDIANYLKRVLPLWGLYILGSTVVLWILSMIYARTVEGKKYARRS